MTRFIHEYDWFLFGILSLIWWEERKISSPIIILHLIIHPNPITCNFIEIRRFTQVDRLIWMRHSIDWRWSSTGQNRVFRIWFTHEIILNFDQLTPIVRINIDFELKLNRFDSGLMKKKCFDWFNFPFFFVRIFQIFYPQNIQGVDPRQNVQEIWNYHSPNPNDSSKLSSWNFDSFHRIEFYKNLFGSTNYENADRLIFLLHS